MDNKPGMLPRILLEVPDNNSESDSPRRRCHSLSKVQDDEQVQRSSSAKKRSSFRKTLTRTWSKRITFRSKSIETRSAPNASPVKSPTVDHRLSAEECIAREKESLALDGNGSVKEVMRERGRSRERRAVSMEPRGIPRGSHTVRPTCINFLVSGATETAALFTVESGSPSTAIVVTQSSNDNVSGKEAIITANEISENGGGGGGNVNYDLEELKIPHDPALLNGSTSNFGSAGARSAPSTPATTTSIGPPILSAATAGNNGTGGGDSNIPSPTTGLTRSPSHNLFSKSDRGNLKQLSTSAPIMTAQAQSPEPPSPKGSTSNSNAKETSSKSVPYKAKQKKFHRHFPAALQDDVLNYYSCALIGDILLQGHLYITKNYFAFYSNVFGYVTKLLIPMQSVQKITKERTARIIPNAVGITTCEDKHVFGSLISRDATYRYMNDVWETAKKEMCDEENLLPSPPPSDSLMDLSESSETREESGRESASDVTSRFRKCASKPTENYSDSVDGKVDKVHEERSNTSFFQETYLKFASASRQNLLLYVTTFLLIILFLSAAVLLYRIGQVQNKYTQALQDNFVLSDNDDVYGELLQWQTHLHSKSAGAMHSFLDSNLDQIAKVRQSLEALSTLLIPSGHSASQTTASNPMDSSDNNS